MLKEEQCSESKPSANARDLSLIALFNKTVPGPGHVRVLPGELVGGCGSRRGREPSALACSVYSAGAAPPQRVWCIGVNRACTPAFGPTGGLLTMLWDTLG